MSNILKNLKLVFILNLMSVYFCQAQTMKPLFQNKKFASYADSIVQGKYSARVLSSTALTSNYQSQANVFCARRADFDRRK